MNADDKLRDMIERVKKDPQIAEEREKYAAMLELEVKGRRSQIEAEQRAAHARAMEQVSQANEKTVNDAARLAGLRKLAAHFSTIEGALQEYARTSRDVDEGLDARRALELIRELQQVGA